MVIFVINCGSSSIKFQLIDMDKKKVLAKGLLDRVGISGSKLKFIVDDKQTTIVQPVNNHTEGIHLIMEILTNPASGVIKDKSEIAAVGHRAVHGGEKFQESVLVTEDVIDQLVECIPLAPLHNPPNISGIRATMSELPGIPQVCTFDTAFHQTIPKSSYLYAIPYEYYEKYKIRRFGFHGTSHVYVAKQGALKLNKKIEELKIITCHLGNGSSMTAIKNGKSIDTSMGFTPLEGLIMGTRCGDIDPAIPMFLQRNEGLSHEEVDVILNKKSGVRGVSQISSDMRDIEKKYLEGDPRAALVLDMFAFRIKKYIGAYIAIMNGVDLIIFTAGIGENDFNLRKRILSDFENLGILFDEQANNVKGEFAVISKPESSIKVMVIPTNEELEIAEQTMLVIAGEKNRE